MASTSDIRDIMNLGQAGPRQPAPKKKRHVEPQVRMTGVKREVQALMGDSVPPIALVEQRSYKSRPSISQKLFKPRHWEERPFQHGARTDGLQLRHWKRSIPGSTARPASIGNTAASTDVEMTDDSKPASVTQELRFEEEFPSHKWDVKVQVASYTDEQYQSYFKSDDWTKEETDYLIELCRDYDLRWVVIADRYDPEQIPGATGSLPNGEAAGNEVAHQRKYPARSMEALKQRYYTIAAKMLELQIPASNMTQAEFQLWEKMRNFDARTESLRKAMAEKLFERTKDEADEERVLLEELHRITKHEDELIKMRSELYSRLEPVTPLRRNEEQSTAVYQTSGGLSMLLQSLLAKEKRLKRPPPANGTEATPAAATPSESARSEKSRHPNQYSRRDTVDTQATEESGPQKKGSVSQPSVRVLSPQDEARFGVSHPQERVTSGVQFRHEKINRLLMAKSQTQTAKIQAALTELGIPPRLLMPTQRVCRVFEQLVGEINVLLDARKVNEKIATEIKILEEARRIRLGLPKDGEEKLPPAVDAMEVDSFHLDGNTKIENGQEHTIATTKQEQDTQAGTSAPATKTEEKTEDSLSNNDQHNAQVNGHEQKSGDTDADNDGEEAGQESSLIPQESADKHGEEEDGSERDDDDDEDNEHHDGNADQSVTGIDHEDEDEDEDEEEDDEPHVNGEVDEEEDEDDDAQVQATPQNDSDAEEEDDAEAEAESGSEEEEAAGEDGHSDDEDDAAEQDDSDAVGGEDANEDDDVDGEEHAAPEAGSATATGPRAHKRSASVLSEASRAGSNRSGLGRKKRR
ncbi:swr complex subunit [Exophiala dermatitidis]|uniref:SWR1-complex protein 4 n=2 Tax=Exophiala dermatitidis TaxID=5970 RepID=H6BVN4_EXODN|nr:DNA methyltransferase 1-associated protein 1 [Exophiala dermatitidis NIH/UT8656]KAJ4511451.1 swr complex subunit [Exophiala dermatitidis]EHY55909.1 DNA methyltransferase 1-associated protein 1 [Exophiala dermatitidis NIH/UT8656]KAJ4514211.1 swr complex subunit [Exophiala dermatitidis]KAJ4515305.1 swr complex subunit [Exophiala dermatitidis]KAJ4533861.1 swr complex subunit [Exophiala dermatitidis]